MFYDRFAELCREKGVKPGRACIEMGLSRSLAAKWKATRTNRPSTEALEKMARYFQLTIDEILRDAGDAAARDDFTYALFSHTQSLTEENRKKILEMAEFFKQQQEKEQK